MGGHGGLNILPQKSWNVYSARNRERVRRDEAQAATDAANAALVESTERSRANLQTLRARSTGAVAPDAAGPSSDTILSSASAAPSVRSHINFFADAELEERRARRDDAKRREDARSTARLMPHLDLSKSAREAVPWYARVPEAASIRSDDPPATAVPAATLDTTADDAAASGLSRHHHHRRHGRRSDHEKGRKKRRRHDSSPSPEAISSRRLDDNTLVRLRQERLDRERREQQRAAASTSSNAMPGERSEQDSATRQNTLRARFMELTGQATSLKPRR